MQNQNKTSPIISNNKKYVYIKKKFIKGSVTWHTIILKYVANRCIYEPTLCGFESFVTKFYTLRVYDTFRLKCVVIRARGSSSTCFCQARGFNSTCFHQAQGLNSKCAIKTSSLTKTCAIRTSSLKNNTFLPKVSYTQIV